MSNNLKNNKKINNLKITLEKVNEKIKYYNNIKKNIIELNNLNFVDISEEEKRFYSNEYINIQKRKENYREYYKNL